MRIKWFYKNYLETQLTHFELLTSLYMLKEYNAKHNKEHYQAEFERYNRIRKEIKKELKRCETSFLIIKNTKVF